jgi:hypothetical protein
MRALDNLRVKPAYLARRVVRILRPANHILWVVVCAAGCVRPEVLACLRYYSRLLAQRNPISPDE